QGNAEFLPEEIANIPLVHVIRLDGENAVADHGVQGVGSVGRSRRFGASERALALSAVQNADISRQLAFQLEGIAFFLFDMHTRSQGHQGWVLGTIIFFPHPFPEPPRAARPRGKPPAKGLSPPGPGPGSFRIPGNTSPGCGRGIRFSSSPLFRNAFPPRSRSFPRRAFARENSACLRWRFPKPSGKGPRPVPAYRPRRTTSRPRGSSSCK